MCFTYGRIVLYYILILILRAVVLMCGRYHFSAEQSTEILKIIQEVQDKCGAAAARDIRQGEITPGCKMPVLIGAEGSPTPELLVWGFRTPKSLLINTRAETALEKPTFAESDRVFSAHDAAAADKGVIGCAGWTMVETATAISVRLTETAAAVFFHRLRKNSLQKIIQRIVTVSLSVAFYR